MKHCWVPTDSQGYSMACRRCGAYIAHPVMGNPDSQEWDLIQEQPCSGSCRGCDESDCKLRLE
ncbi:MAG: hypothetical protein QXI12_10480 [Candidatus Methanomethyliaceae archaeon]